MKDPNTPSRYRKLGLIGRLAEDVVLLLAMIRDLVLGRYRRLPVWSLLVLCGAIAYILFPVDLLPDYIPGYGQIDDAIVALGCLFFLEKDLTVYKAWRNHQGG